ncbi:MAG: hypothetical protein OEM79_02625 [Nitrosopumilus sp.]|nr:hypothetical protein [Nitrosopumilus sp.]
MSDEDSQYCRICGDAEFDEDGYETHDDEYDHEFELEDEEDDSVTVDDIKDGLDILGKGLDIAKKYQEVSTPRPPLNEKRPPQEPRIISDNEAKFIGWDILRGNKRKQESTLKENDKNDSKSWFKKHYVGLIVLFVGIAGSVIFGAIFSDDIAELVNEPEIILELRSDKGEFILDTFDVGHKNNDKIRIELFVNIINIGKSNANNVCIKLAEVPPAPDWIDFHNVEFLGGSENVPSNEKESRVCTAVIFPNDQESLKFTFSIMPEAYAELISLGIEPKMGFEIEYDEISDGFQELYQVIL